MVALAYFRSLPIQPGLHSCLLDAEAAQRRHPSNNRWKVGKERQGEYVRGLDVISPERDANPGFIFVALKPILR